MSHLNVPLHIILCKVDLVQIHFALIDTFTTHLYSFWRRKEYQNIPKVPKNGALLFFI